jgi:hypothetical protein
MRTPRENSPPFVTPELSAAPLAVFLAVLGCCAASASAADDHASDVTITVVEDPKQLKEKVNTIRLPDADEDSRAAQKSGHQTESDKNSHDAGDRQRNEAAESHRNSVNKTQSAAEAAKSEANDAQQQRSDAHGNDSNQ